MRFLKNEQIAQLEEPYDDYWVSSVGNVYSTKRAGLIKRRTPKNGRGRPQVSLSANGVKVHRKVHRLVAEYFIGPCPDGMEVCHFDGNPENNNIENLRYDTRSGNMADAIRHGSLPWLKAGWRGPNVKLDDKKVLAIRSEYASGGSSYRSLAKTFEVSHEAVRLIVSGETWRDI